MAAHVSGGVPEGAYGVYISYPFCRQKCTYCNFSSGVFARSLKGEYLAALRGEIAQSPRRLADTLYVGGGTPSLLDPEEFDALLAPLARTAWSEATIEAAPGDVTAGRARAWARNGINRVSLGVQSFVPEIARAAGRRHTPETVASEIRLLRGAGIQRVNIDLIAGLAHETAGSWSASLDWVERLGVRHVSVYMLEVDDDSRLGGELRRGGTRYGAAFTPSEDQILEFYLTAMERLRRLGIERYEISNFAERGEESLHNLKYWTMRPYAGFGADAHSFDGEKRWSNVPDAPAYAARWREGRSVRESEETLDPARNRDDMLMTGLRLRQGVTLPAADLQELNPRLDRLVERGWLERGGENAIRLSDQGFIFSNEALAELIP